ncbi:sensor histidine kinase [Alkalilacustris brevis]|uniref:sensor histidine kinase n=1 Tax=Alkalilacustris brevis TaxID=2026338 RepID=UPI000E0D20E7|nr:HAMP domain-containing sensor histidine kinase [Alkalilacustris brevis]
MSSADMPIVPDRPARLSLYGPFLPLLLVCLGPLAFALAQTSALERDMRIAATENMLWVVTQTQMESLSLTAAAAASDQTEAAVDHRYDMTLARLNLLQQGPQQRYMQKLGYADEIAEMSSRMRALDPQMHGHGPEQHAALYRAGVDMQPLLNRIANEVMTTEWIAASERLDDYRAVQRMVIVAVAFALLGALAMSWVLLRNQRELHRAELVALRAERLHALLEKERGTSAWYRDFAAMVSHQMRTPLTLIDSAMHRLARKGKAVTAADIAERQAVVRDAVGRLTRLVDAALLAGRLDNGQLVADTVAQPVRSLAQQAIDEMRARHPDRRIALSEGEAGLAADCDALLVGHVLGNLLSNALKYSAADSPVELRIFAQGNRVALAVTDRGAGIAPEDQPRVFERYYRGQGSETGTGTGLGLALAHDLARLQGGDVTMETWVGKGSVFTLWLPRAALREENE